MTISRWFLAFALFGYACGHIVTEVDEPLQLLVGAFCGLIFGITSLIAERYIHA